MRKTLLALPFLLLLGQLNAQNKDLAISSVFGDDSRVFVEQSIRQGFYVPFSQRHQYTKDFSVFGLDLRIGRQTDGSKAWEAEFDYPSYGVLLRYEHNTLDSAKYEHRDADGHAVTDWVPIGDCYTVAGFLDGHFFSGKKWTFDYGFTFGLSFWPKYGNEFIGSPIDAHLAVQSGFTLYLNNHLDLCARAIFSHSSDGALKLPNYGTNVLSGNIGLCYHPLGKPVRKIKEPEPWHPTCALYIANAFGALQTNTLLYGRLPAESPYYIADFVQVGFTNHFHPKFRYCIGFEMGYTGETKVKYEQAHIRALGNPDEDGVLETSLEEFSFLKATHLAASCSFEVIYDKLAVCLGVGYYLYHGIYLGTEERKTWFFSESSMTAFERQYLPTDYRNFYERLGLKYYFGESDRFYAGLFVKAHASVDYIEWTLGMHLFQSKSDAKQHYL